MCPVPSTSCSENGRGWVPDKQQTGTQITPHPTRPAHSRPQSGALPRNGDRDVGTREAKVAGTLWPLPARLQRAIPGLKVNVQGLRALDGRGEAAAAWPGGAGRGRRAGRGPGGPAGGRGRAGRAGRAGVSPSPALTFLPPSASGLSKQAHSEPAGAAIVSRPVPPANLWSAEAGGRG